jgi:hypothetical protein
MKGPIALTLMFVLASPPRVWALDGNKAAYVGGTIFSFNVSNEPIEGRLDIGPHRLVFVPDGGPHAAGRLRIDYASVRHLELGQKAERRGPLVVGATVLVGPFGLLLLSAKRRAHYLTLVYADEMGENQVVVMELGKNVARAALDALEAHTGLAMEYQDEAARKWSR